MTLLASQIPIIYCLMYFQSNRRAVRNQSNMLLEALAPQRRWSRFPRSFLEGSKELSGHPKRSPASFHDNKTSPGLEDRPWVWHQQADPRKLCLERYFNSSQTRPSTRVPDTFPKKDECSMKQPTDVHKIMAERFMTVDKLQTLITEVARTSSGRGDKPSRRYEAVGASYADLMASSDSHCGICNTEIGYEVMTHIQDLKGVNHTVINFHNAYQFIPAGRCINENSPCGGGGNARCVQVYRAQWTLVWAASSGTQLVAHEVPSHCQCTNVGRSPAMGTDRDSPLVKSLRTEDAGPVSSSGKSNRTLADVGRLLGKH